jgi:hypothetical protein
MTDREQSLDGLATYMHRCANTPGFVDEFNQLTGLQFGPDSAPDSVDTQVFCAFVDKYVYRPVLQQTRRQGETSSPAPTGAPEAS